MQDLTGGSEEGDWRARVCAAYYHEIMTCLESISNEGEGLARASQAEVSPAPLPTCTLLKSVSCCIRQNVIEAFVQ